MTPVRALSLGLILTASAGFVDAVGFISLGGFYTSFMSGNTTQLGTGLANGAGWALVLPAGLIFLFFVGSFLGSLLARSNASYGPALTLCLVVIGISLTLGLHLGGFPPMQSMLPLAAAAGAQNAVLQPIGAARLGATFVTGTLFAAGQDLALAVRGKAPRWRWAQHLMVWAALCLGALAGAFAFAGLAFEALLVPAAVYVATMPWFLVARARL
ncbi:MAG: YoaK family protein [Devosia sp.]